MAAPSYTTDLTLITEAESITDWAPLGGTPAGLVQETDFFIQNTYCVSKAVSNTLKGAAYNKGSTITPAANDHFLIWLYATTPGLLDTLPNGGMRVSLGTLTTAYVDFYVRGKDEYIYGGWLCFPIRYRTDGTTEPPYRTVTGSPGSAPQYFGGQLKTINTVKAANLGVDVIRYGTGIYITSGEAGTPATFAGAATQNDSQNNRWGILQVASVGFQLQGRFVVGQANDKPNYTPTAAYFSDSDTLIMISDTTHTLSDFTQLVVDHASTIFNLTNVQFLALGTNNPGRLVFNNASTSSALTSCVFTDFGQTILKAGVTATGCIWNSSGLITQNGATITNCIIQGSTSTASILSDNPGLISNCDFISDGSNHAVEINTPGEYSFNGHTFTGYAAENGSTGNECVYNNSGGAVILNVTTGDTPTYKDGTGATTDVNATRNLVISGLLTGSEVRVLAYDSPTELAGIESSGTSWTWPYEPTITVDISVFKTDYLPIWLENISLGSGGYSTTVQQQKDRQYYNP